MPRTFYSQIWSHSFYPYSGVLRNWDPIKMTYLLCHLHGKECCSLRCASSTTPWQCPNWIHLTDSMRNNRNCCSFLFIFYRVGLIYYTLEIFFLQYNAKQLLFQTANCQYKRNHTIHLFCQTFTWQGYTLEELGSLIQMLKARMDSIAEILGGEGLYLHWQWWMVSTVRSQNKCTVASEMLTGHEENEHNF